MVNVNELRVNNWVGVGSGPNPWLMEIGEDEMEVLMGARDYHNYHPIPLTPEILEKCGFENKHKGNPDYFQRYAHKTSGLSWWIPNQTIKGRKFPNSGLYIDCHDDYYDIPLPHIEYLHQLQNLYFSLTGNELDVKL